MTIREQNFGEKYILQCLWETDFNRGFGEANFCVIDSGKDQKQIVSQSCLITSCFRLAFANLQNLSSVQKYFANSFVQTIGHFK